MTKEKCKDCECNKWFAWGNRLNTIYQPLKGFESKTDPERVKGFEKILKVITDHIGDVEGKKILDIGANVGYFCFNLTDKGATTTGVELDPRRSKLSICVGHKEGYELDNPLFVNGDAPTYVLHKKPDVDYVIFLNTFHHILVQDEKKAWEMFNWLINNTEGIFIMMRNSLKGWKLCDRAAQIPDAVVAQSDATQYVEYESVHGRKIYFFSK